MAHMTRRSFVELATLAAGGLALTGLSGCAGSEEGTPSASQTQDNQVLDAHADSSSTTEASEEASTQDASAVYLVRSVDGTALQTVFDAIGRSLGNGKVGVKLSSGEPGGNHYLQPSLIEGLVSSVAGTIVECNTAYGGARSTSEAHLDEAGSLSLPVQDGFHLSEDLVGAAFTDYDAFLVLSHFKGHAIAGFGGALKNISIGMASREGKLLIHSAGANRTSWETAAQDDFLESMADACQAVLAAQPNMLFVNVMNNLSVDCDCDANPAPPKMADIGVLASSDPVALDQACVDLVYASDDDSADLIERMESRHGVHVLEAAESLGVGRRAYELIEIS